MTGSISKITKKITNKMTKKKPRRMNPETKKKRRRKSDSNNHNKMLNPRSLPQNHQQQLKSSRDKNRNKE